jgi:hypothetical protein
VAWSTGPSFGLKVDEIRMWLRYFALTSKDVGDSIAASGDSPG